MLNILAKDDNSLDKMKVERLDSIGFDWQLVTITSPRQQQS